MERYFIVRLKGEIMKEPKFATTVCDDANIDSLSDDALDIVTRILYRIYTESVTDDGRHSQQVA